MYIQDYPRPQFVRESWDSLNGEWDFRFDDGNVGEKAKWYEEFDGDLKIMVPFTYETKASGINDNNFHHRCWYQKTFTIDRTEKRRLRVNRNNA